mmetsp:Transcript_12598/g.31684  ORF Transcript_12598/g.31684 Transcript_12598/m.31684 type:complete len:203 (+) Transcript_12598:796-1404(+)
MLRGAERQSVHLISCPRLVSVPEVGQKPSQNHAKITRKPAPRYGRSPPTAHQRSPTEPRAAQGRSSKQHQPQPRRPPRAASAQHRRPPLCLDNPRSQRLWEQGLSRERRGLQRRAGPRCARRPQPPRSQRRGDTAKALDIGCFTLRRPRAIAPGLLHAPPCSSSRDEEGGTRPGGLAGRPLRGDSAREKRKRAEGLRFGQTS